MSVMGAMGRGLLTESDLPGPSWSRMAVAGLSQTLTPPADPTLGPDRREITLTVSATLHNQPWFHPTLSQLAKFLSLGDDWDGYGAKATHEGAVKRAVAVLNTVCPAGPEPWVVPTSDGGVQIEWASNGLEIEIEVSPTGPAQILIVEPSGEESEMPAFSNSTEIWEQLHDRIAAMGRSTA